MSAKIFSRYSFRPGSSHSGSEGSNAFGKEDKTMRYRVAAINKLRREEMAHRGVAPSTKAWKRRIEMSNVNSHRPTKNTVSTIHWWFLSVVAVASVSIADAQINLQLPVYGPPDLTVSAEFSTALHPVGYTNPDNGIRERLAAANWHPKLCRPRTPTGLSGRGRDRSLLLEVFSTVSPAWTTAGLTRAQSQSQLFGDRAAFRQPHHSPNPGNYLPPLGGNFCPPWVEGFRLPENRPQSNTRP
jgi:hypothetical protein